MYVRTMPKNTSKTIIIVLGFEKKDHPCVGTLSPKRNEIPLALKLTLTADIDFGFVVEMFVNLTVHFFIVQQHEIRSRFLKTSF
jgi:hypothetical protein